jgi:G3E family GTPase
LLEAGFTGSKVADTLVSEVHGSCFCCNFNGFIDAIQSLLKQGAEIIVAEPVGSCTDLSATIVNPLKKFHPEWDIAPLTVLADPYRFLEVFSGVPSKVDPDALYIQKIQLEEADRIFVNKADILSQEQRQQITDILKSVYPDRKTGLISAKTGEGIDACLADIQTSGDAGITIAEVDYDRYAHGEAVLGWLNATATVSTATVGGVVGRVAGGATSSAALLQNLLTDFQTELKKTGSEVGHVKALYGNAVGNLTALNGTVDVREIAESQPAALVFNARVQTSPETLEKTVRDLFASRGLKVETLKCLMPGRPNPTHRFSDVV